MKKLDLLVSNIYLIDFKMFFKLFKRYWYISLACPILVVAFCGYLYKSQHVVYVSEVKFRTSNDDSSTQSKVFKIIGESSQTLDLVQIQSIITSWEFLPKVANDLLNDPEFKSFNLNPVGTRTLKSQEEVFASCKGALSVRDCKINILTGIIPGFIKVDEISTSVIFGIKAATLSLNFSEVLLKSIVKEFKLSRVETAKGTILQQRNIMRNMLSSKKEELAEKGLLNFYDEKKLQEQDLGIIGNKISNTKTLISRASSQYDDIAASISLIKGKKTAGVASQNRRDYELYESLKKKAVLVRNNIDSLKNSSDLSNTDQGIIASLEGQLRSYEIQIKRLEGKVRNIASDDKFVAEQGDKLNDLELKKGVLKKSIQEHKKDLIKLEAEREKIAKNLAVLTKREKDWVVINKFINQIESKIISLDLISTSTLPDVVFESINPNSKEFKPTSKSQIIAFSIILSFLLTFVVIFLRFISDDVIFSREELEKMFDGIEVIGEAPKFD